MAQQEIEKNSTHSTKIRKKLNTRHKNRQKLNPQHRKEKEKKHTCHNKEIEKIAFST